jgi:uncharacterized protein YqgV (UPF0045/DUF77 family)
MKNTNTNRTQLTETQIEVSLSNIDAMIAELNQAIKDGCERSTNRIAKHITHEANRITYGVR